MNFEHKLKAGAVFLFYLCLSVAMTWPMAISLHKYPIAEQMDIAAAFYNFWWQYYSIFELHVSPWFNTVINYPDGYSAVPFPLYLSYGVFAWAAQLLFGSPQALPAFFNWVSILSFAFTGFLAYLLCKEITGSSAGATVAGILFSFLPFHYWNLPRCHASCLEFLLLPALCYFRMLKRKDLCRGVYFGLSLVPVLYQSPNYVIYLAIFFGLHFLYLLAFERSSLDRNLLKSAAAGVLLAAALAGPFLYEAGKELLSNATPVGSTLREQSRYSANLLGFVLPGPDQTLYRGLGRWTQSLTGGFGVGGREIFPGYVLLFTGLPGIFLARARIKHYGFWLMALAVFFILSLGPYLVLGWNTFYDLPLPYFYLRKVFFFFQMDRSPVRIVVLALLSLAVFSAGLLRLLEDRFKSRKRLVSGIIGALAIMELIQAPVKVDRVDPPAFYREMGSDPQQYTILELPLLPDIYRFSGFFQPYHHKRLALDLTARKVGAGLAKSPLLYYLDEPLRFFRLDPGDQARAKDEIQAELKRRELRYVIVYLKFIDEGKKNDLDRLAKVLSPEAGFDSAGVLKIYRFGYGGK